MEKYTLRANDVNPAQRRAIESELPILDARLGDPKAHGLMPPYFLQIFDHPRLGYTDALGLPQLREVLRSGNPELGQGRYRLPIENVAIGAGISGIVRNLLDAIIDPSKGDTVLIPHWSYIIYLSEAARSGARVGNIRLTKTGEPDLDHLKDSIDTNTRAVFLTTIGNPLGVAVSRETFGKIVKIINEKEKEFDHPIILVADPIYEGFRIGGQPLDPIALSIESRRLGPTVSLYSVSKLMALPDWRLGIAWFYEGSGEFRAEFRELLAAFATTNQPLLGSASTTHQADLQRFYSGLIKGGTYSSQFDKFKSDRVATVRSRVHDFSKALFEIDGLVFPDCYYDKAGRPSTSALNSFYVMAGIDPNISPRGELSLARRFADFLIENDRKVVLATPGDSFLEQSLRGQGNEFMRFVALLSEADAGYVVEQVKAFVNSLK